MADVVFVTPNFNGYVREEPIGTLLLATILEKAGVSTKILQYHQFGSIDTFDGFIENAVQAILSHAPKIVSFYTRCDTYHISIKIAQHIKKRANDIYVVFGGPQADISAADTLRAIPEIDYICCGEGETTIVPFFSSLIAGTPDHTVRGLVFQQDNRIFTNPRPELIADLDSLPSVDYTLLDFKEDEHAAYVRQLFPVDVGRGCPFSCTFCSTKAFWGRNYRLKSADRIIAEIKHIHKTFGVTSFNFEHDMFTLDRKKVIRICEMIKGLGFSITWRCSARIDCLDEELIDIMVDAGLKFLFVGIESGSPNMQKKIQKNLKLDNVYEKLSYIGSKGVAITASFIFGFPEETEEDFSQTIRLMTRLSNIPDINLQHHLCAFFAGTELTAKYIDLIKRASTFSDTTGELAVRECNDLINAHPVLFPHFFEYKNEFREKVKYYPQFFDCWTLMHPVYEYIALQYYEDNLCNMLYDFSCRNQAALCSGATRVDLLAQDQFLDSFRNDKHYALLKEVARFLIWSIDPNAIRRDVFAFDVKAFLNGTQITELARSFTIVSLEKDSAGKRKIVLLQQK